jgi:lysophospholipase L1-like esterase
MPRRIIGRYTKGRSVPIAAIGDSLTFNTSYKTMPHQFHPEVLAGLLRDEGCPVYARNFGQSGDTTTGMRARMTDVLRFETPKLVTLWGGVNDPGTAITGATTQDNLETIGEYLLDNGVTYLLVGNTQYLNYTSGGDDINTPFATYATLRPFQLAATNALIAAYPGRVAYADIYGYMRALIVAGTVVDNSASWHVANTDQHLNPLGEQYVAAALLATIEAQSGWMDGLKYP